MRGHVVGVMVDVSAPSLSSSAGHDAQQSRGDAAEEAEPRKAAGEFWLFL